MPEYRSPGVCVEEVPSGPRPIEGVSTSDAAFVGPTRLGPIDRVSDPLTCLADVERECGDGADLNFADGATTSNYLWHAARAFFENGGRRLRIVRTGTDGRLPALPEYVAALKRLEEVSDVALVAAPGATVAYESRREQADGIVQALLAHAERTRRFAVVDSGDALSASDVRAMRTRFSSAFGALYYPWVRVIEPQSGAELHVPPSGFVTGIYARVDTTRGVHKAPANEVLIDAAGLERSLSAREQDALNAEGINCLRAIAGRGIVIWGARTLSADSEWKYVNLRRYLLFLEASIDRGTQWVVFEPNGESLWSAVSRTIGSFLSAQWKEGALQGDTLEKAFFVKCDRTTMTQDDIANGRLVCLIGVAPVRPAEFVIFRIGQWTADRPSGARQETDRPGR